MYKQKYLGKIYLLVYFLSSTKYLEVASKLQNLLIAPSDIFLTCEVPWWVEPSFLKFKSDQESICSTKYIKGKKLGHDSSCEFIERYLASLQKQDWKWLSSSTVNPSAFCFGT